MTSLYALSEAYIQFLQAVEGGDIPLDAINDTLESVDGDFAEKADNIASMIKQLRAEEKALKDERQALAAREVSKKNFADRMTEYLSECMQRAGRMKLDTPHNLVSFRRSERVLLEDEDAIMQAHPEFCKTTIFLQKSEIKQALKDGAVISGARLEERQNIQIR